MSDQQDWPSRYRELSDDGLMQLAIEGGLVPEAESALRQEMQRRSLSDHDVRALSDWQQQQKPVPPPQRVFLGYGVRFVGKKFLSEQEERSGVFVSTKFIVLNRVCLIPVGSYRLKQNSGKYPDVEGRVALQHDQVWSGLWPALALFGVGMAGAALSIYTSRPR